jgi:hypothetical protein
LAPPAAAVVAVLAPVAVELPLLAPPVVPVVAQLSLLVQPPLRARLPLLVLLPVVVQVPVRAQLLVVLPQEAVEAEVLQLLLSQSSSAAMARITS